MDAQNSPPRGGGILRAISDAMALIFDTIYNPGPYPRREKQKCAYSERAVDELILRDRLALDRTVLANERTALAYVRTGVMFLASGVTVVKVFAGQADLILLGYVLVVVAAGVFLGGCARYWSMRHRILDQMNHPDAPEPNSRISQEVLTGSE